MGYYERQLLVDPKHIGETESELPIYLKVDKKDPTIIKESSYVRFTLTDGVTRIKYFRCDAEASEFHGKLKSNMTKPGDIYMKYSDTNSSNLNLI